MPSTPSTSKPAASVEEQFLDLVYGDADLLAAEFGAIIAAEWPQTSADKPGRGAAPRLPGDGPDHRTNDPGRDPVSRPRHPGVGGWARQRSPPVRHRTHNR